MSDGMPPTREQISNAPPQRRIFLRSIQSVLLAILLVAVVPVFVLQCVTFSSRFVERRAQEAQTNLELASAMTKTLDAYLHDIEHQEYAIGLMLTQKTTHSPQEISEILARNSRQYPALRNYFWVSPQGRVLVSTDQRMVGVSIADRPYFMTIRDGAPWSVSDLIVGRSTNTLNFTVARGIRDADGHLRGVMAAAVDPARLDELFSLALSNRGAIIILDAKGCLVYRHPQSSLSWADRHATVQTPLHRLFSSHRTTYAGTLTINEHSGQSLVGAVRSEVTQWTIVAERPERDVVLPLVYDLIREISLLVMVAGVGFLVALLLRRALVSPVRDVCHLVAAIGAGEYHQRAKRFATCELDELGQGINRMAEEIQRSNDTLQVLVKTMPVGVVFCAPSGEVKLANAEATRLLGGEITGSPTGGLQGRYSIYTLDGAPFPSDRLPLVRALRFGEAVRDVDIVVRLHTGEEEIISVSATPMLDAQGQITGAVAVMGDVTEHRRAKQRMYEEKEQLLVTLRSIGDGVITTDSNGRVVLMNAVAETLTGWAQQDAAGHPLEDVFHIIHQHTRQRCPNPVDLVLSSRQTVQLQNHTVLVARDGTERVIADSGAPIFSAAQDILGVVLVFRDVTAQEYLEAEMQRAEKLESVGVLAGGIAHDFNNLLAAMTGNLSLVRMKLASEHSILRHLCGIELAVQQATHLTQQLLTFAKGGDPVRTTASLAEVLQEASQFVLRGSNVKCRLDVAPDLWPADIDRGQISRVIHNLVMNADQAMPEGGVITIRAENLQLTDTLGAPLAPGPYLHVAVIDEGVGIPHEHLFRIFEPYFTTKRAGSGLGLASAYAIIKKHGGHIRVDSTQGVGTTFTILLPANPAGRTLSPGGTGMLQQGQGRILALDDDELIREVLTELLEHVGYEVVTVSDGREVIATYQQAREEGRPFDLVIMDLTIPGGMGGKETISQLRAIDPDVVALVSSGYSNDPIMADYHHYGFQGVLAKPYRPHELCATIHQLLGS